MKRNFLLTMSFLSLLVSCSTKASSSSSISQSSSSTNTSDNLIFLDQSYGTHERNKFDMYVPKEYKKNGLILYIHGGAWVTGSKDEYRSTLYNYAKLGYAAAAINYRYVSANSNCYDILDDIEASLFKIKKLGVENGINFENVALIGHSAGAHLSLLYGYKMIDESPIKPIGVCSLAGPTDLTLDSYYTNFGEYATQLFSFMTGVNYSTYPELCKEKLKELSPINHVNENTIQTIIAQGEKDDIVDKENAIVLDEVLTKNNVQHQLILFPNSGHGLEEDESKSNETFSAFSEMVITNIK